MSEPDSKLDQDRFSALRRAEASFRSQPSDSAQTRLIASAVDLLVLGFDTPNLRIIAGEDSADTGEVSYYLNATLGDLGLRPLDDRAVVLMVLDEIAADLIDGRLEPRTAARLLWDTWHPKSWDIDFGPEAQALANTATGIDDLWPEPYAPTFDDLRDAAKAYLDRDRTIEPATNVD
jgi:hypothetical protein